MLDDILMAFMIAYLIELYSFINKKFLILVVCFTIIFIYFINGLKIDFIGEIDFGVWLLFVIISDQIIASIMAKLNKRINE